MSYPIGGAIWKGVSSREKNLGNPRERRKKWLIPEEFSECGLSDLAYVCALYGRTSGLGGSSCRLFFVCPC